MIQPLLGKHKRNQILVNNFKKNRSQYTGINTGNKPALTKNNICSSKMKNPPKRPQHNPSALDALARKKKTEQTAFKVKMQKTPLLVTSQIQVNYEINTR